jgi:hypothetical protein
VRGFEHESGDDRLGQYAEYPARHVIGSVQRPARRGDHAAAVRPRGDIRGEQIHQRVEVAARTRGHEPGGDMVALGLVGVETRSAGLHVPLGAMRDLPDRGLRPVQGLGDLGVRVAEDLAQQEDRTFDGTECFQDHQHRRGDGVGQFGLLGDVR